MFGKNPIMKQELGDGSSLRVVKGSPFYTIQGEGPFMGQPAVFVRLHGCNLRCWFCDTEFSSPDDPTWDTMRLARAVLDECRFNRKHGQTDLVVLTGGEPMRQNIYLLCKLLLSQGLRVQIETAGSLWVDKLDELIGIQYGHRLTIVCSPKTPTIHGMIRTYAHVFKYVIGSDTTVDDTGMPHANTQREKGFERALAPPGPGARIYLSPMDEYNELANTRNRKRVAQLALKHGYVAGVQMHKLLEIDEP